MHIQTHVLSGWCLSNYLNVGPRERLFCMIAASFPDLDGLSMLAGREAYWTYHHVIGHNALVGLAVAALLAGFSPHRLRSFLAYVGLFHLHLLMDCFGSGPGWEIAYGWPLSSWTIESHAAWEFYSWQNISVGLCFVVWTVVIACRQRRTPLEVLMPSLDRQLVALAARLADFSRQGGKARR